MHNTKCKSLLRLIGVLISLLLILNACGRSKSPRFYHLNSAEISSGAQIKGVKSDILSIRMEKLIIADYLKHPQIAIHVSENEILYDEFQRWAEPLDYNIESVLQQNLRSGIPENVIMLPKYNSGKDINYTIEISILYLNIQEEKGVSMMVKTDIFKGSESVPMKTLYKSYESKTARKSMDEYVKDISSLLVDYSADLSGEIGKL
jgi:uncharacterized protein